MAQEGTRKSILTALWTASSAVLAASVFGLITTKIIAVYAGETGVAVIGIYRSLSAMMTAAASIGFGEILAQRLSVTTVAREKAELLHGAVGVLSLQIVACAFVAIVFGRQIAGLLFATGEPVLTSAIRVVIAFTSGALALQLAIAALNGLGMVRDSSICLILTSFATMLTAVPLARAGRLGLAFLIGPTCFVGAAYALVRLLPLARGASFTPAKLLTRPSPWIAIQPLIAAVCALFTQSVVVRGFSLDELGFYNAAFLLQSTSMIVVTACMRPFVMPLLGRATSAAEKSHFLNSTLAAVLAALMLGATALVLASPILISALFSRAFAPAVPLVGILAVAMTAELVAWSGAMHVLHAGNFRLYLCIDSLTLSLRAAGALVVVTHDGPLAWIAWVHVVTSMLAAAIYTVVSHRMGAPFSQRNVATAIIGAIVLFACRNAVGNLVPTLAAGFAALATVAVALDTFSRLTVRSPSS